MNPDPSMARGFVSCFSHSKGQLEAAEAPPEAAAAAAAANGVNAGEGDGLSPRLQADLVRTNSCLSHLLMASFIITMASTRFLSPRVAAKCRAVGAEVEERLPRDVFPRE